MPDLDLHRDILMTYLADDKHRADQLFSSCNRSLKKTLQQYYTPDDSVETIPVSYTHLTLPTICSV